ncbi:MAG: hypothetical protein V4484_21940 [Pseudomonadota bacterium]
MRSPAGLGIAASIFLFCIALTLPAFSYVSGQGALDHMPGYLTLLLGVFGTLMGLIDLFTRGDAQYLGYLSWIANLMLPLAWVLLASGERSKACYAGIAALGLSLLFLMIHSFSLPDHGEMAMAGPGIGYFCWLASMGAIVLATFLPGGQEVASKRDPKARYVDW